MGDKIHHDHQLYGCILVDCYVDCVVLLCFKWTQLCAGQIFESIVCEWRYEITGGFIQDSGPAVSLSELDKRNFFTNKRPSIKFQLSDMGKILDLPRPTRGGGDAPGCHGAGDLSSFYHPNVTAPTELLSEWCNDNMVTLTPNLSLSLILIVTHNP